MMLIMNKQLFVFCPLTDIKQIPFQDTQVLSAPGPGTALAAPWFTGKITDEPFSDRSILGLFPF